MTTIIKSSFANAFPPNSTRSVWRNTGLDAPLKVRLRADELDFGPCIDVERPIIRLILEHDALDADLLETLLERVAGCLSVLPPGIKTDERGCIEVPLLEDKVVDSDAIRWRIIDPLWLEHADRNEIYFVLQAGVRRRAHAQFDLTLGEAWTLVRALASAQEWQALLEYDYAGAATARRTALLPPH